VPLERRVACWACLLIELSQQGLEAVERDNDVARARLQRMHAFYEFLLTELDGAMAKWKEKYPRV
jgi:hypothetical protein